MSETRTIQVHPDNDNYCMDVFTSFGWSVISNQRCQEESWEGDQKYINTFAKITVTRDKEVKVDDEKYLYHVMEKVADLQNYEKPTIESLKPKKPGKGKLIVSIIFGLLAILDVIGFTTSFIANATGNKDLFFLGDSLGSSLPLLFILSPSIILFIIFFAKYFNGNKKYKNAKEEFDKDPEGHLKDALARYNKAQEELNSLVAYIAEKSVEYYGTPKINYSKFCDYITYLNR